MGNVALVQITVPNHRLLNLDIKDIYAIIPISKTIKITKSQLLKNNDIQTTNQIITILEIVLNFSFQGQIYQPDKGLAMGSPVSGTMAEIFLQHLENTHVKHLIESNILSFYTRYVDDILVMYDSTLTTPDNIQRYLTIIHNNIQLSLTHENNHSVNFLDLTITRKQSHLDISIYRKPTTTDTTINILFNHPPKHKLVAYWFLINRMLTLPIPQEQRHEEWQNILHFAHRNNFPRSLITNLKHRIEKKLTQPTPPTTPRHDTKWTTFRSGKSLTFSNILT